MAKAKKAAAATEEGAPAKAKKSIRKTSDLAHGSTHDKVFALARKAFQLGNRQNPTTKQVGKYKRSDGDFNGVPSLQVKFPNGAFYQHTKPTAAYWKLLEASEKFQSIVASARSAKGGLVAGEWNGAVQSFLQEFMSVAGARGGGGGSKSYSGAGVEDIDL